MGPKLLRALGILVLLFWLSPRSRGVSPGATNDLEAVPKQSGLARSAIEADSFFDRPDYGGRTQLFEVALGNLFKKISFCQYYLSR
jgi:hypothetical protein